MLKDPLFDFGDFSFFADYLVALGLRFQAEQLEVVEELAAGMEFVVAAELKFEMLELPAVRRLMLFVDYLVVVAFLVVVELLYFFEHQVVVEILEVALNLKSNQKNSF